MAKQRTEEEKEAILVHCLELEETGGDILGYLWSQDYLTPRATWFNYQREWLGRKPYQYTDGKPRKGENDMKLTLENKKRAVEIAASGTNPLPFLRSLGIKNASATWCLIKKGLQKADPETFAKLPASFRKDAPELVAKVDGPVIVETPEAIQAQVTESSITISKDKIVAAVSKPKITKPVMYDGLEVSAVRDHDLGEFYYDHDRNCIDWRNPFGDEVSLGVAGWKTMAERLVKILNVLGVSA